MYVIEWPLLVEEEGWPLLVEEEEGSEKRGEGGGSRGWLTI
jgi:hypothetical protein